MSDATTRPNTPPTDFRQDAGDPDLYWGPFMDTETHELQIVWTKAHATQLRITTFEDEFTADQAATFAADVLTWSAKVRSTQ